MIQFGENVEGYSIPVLNEREIRAAAGMMFLATFISLMLILFMGNFVPIKYVLLIFLSDFSIRLFLSTKYAPILIISRLIVSNQNPEYVGAAQKKFAWYIGLVLSLTMFILMVIINSYGPITAIVCSVCLILMFFETAFGICFGCKIYKLIKKEKAQYCPGEICDIKAKHEIQKTSINQLGVVLILGVFIYVTYILFHEKFKEEPHDLFEFKKSEQIKH